MLSATTAESRLSTAASSATVRAEGNSGTICSKLECGQGEARKPDGYPAEFVPIVSTGSPTTATASVHPSSATIEPGTRRVTRGKRRMMASDATRDCNRQPVDGAEMRKQNEPFVERTRSARPAVVRPRKSLIWVEAIRSAMPFVNPIVTAGE